MKTAFVGTYGSGKPVIGILAEYDALPNMSQKAGETKPCPIEGKKYGHACGHSALAAGTVGTAIIAKEYLKETGKTGTVKIFGCPAEETGFGKSFMVKKGCFEGLDMCFTWHPMDRTTLWGRTLAYYKVRFDFKGITAHAGGAPELGRSALDDRVMERQYTASTDVGDVSYIVPTTQYSGTTSIPGTGLHTWQFAAQVGTSIGDKGSIAVARAVARACAEVWENPEAVNTAKEELLEATGGVYVSPIPDGIEPGDGM